MKRFYCTVCKRVKRVRKLPRDIQNAHSEKVTERTGTCTRHSLVSVNLKTRKVS